MPDDEPPERIWDEYDWERFLQQQDLKTEKYMELLERYIDHPERDQIIAREMGWYHLLDKDGEKWAEEVDSHFEEELAASGVEADGEAFDKSELEFQVHPLYQASFGLTVWIDQLFEELGEISNQPAAVKLSSQAAVASAKLAAALSDDDVDEIGMTIAYLKRALKAITLAMEAASQFRREARLDPEHSSLLTGRIFHIRDGIIQLMGEYRTEWRRRFDGK